MTPASDGLASLLFTQIWQVTVVAATAGLVASLFCRTRPRLAYLLGIVVLVKCWVPPTWSSPVGLFCWPGKEAELDAKAEKPSRRAAAAGRAAKIEVAEEAPLPRGPDLNTPPEESDDAKRDFRLQVQQAIDRGASFLKASQRDDGSWPDLVGYPGGITALCTLALVKSGIKPDEHRVQLAVRYLRGLKPVRTYSTALQTMVFCTVDPKKDQDYIQRNVEWLCAQQKQFGPFVGAWAYPEADGDNSNSGFAMLALYEAEQVGVQAPAAVWRRALDYWVNAQNPNGSWGYKPRVAGTGTMTFQGLLSLRWV